MDQPKISRILRLIVLLSGNRIYTVDELAAELQTSQRTIYRYIDTFKEAGFAVEKVDDYKYRLVSIGKGIKDLRNIVYFSPEEAFRLSQKLEIHYTPKHGSWLDMAEIELSALSIQCLQGVRIPSIDALNDLLLKWKTARNATQKGISWQFTAPDARNKLKHLYPDIKF